jgi:hypothetical protein
MQENPDNQIALFVRDERIGRCVYNAEASSALGICDRGYPLKSLEESPSIWQPQRLAPLCCHSVVDKPACDYRRLGRASISVSTAWLAPGVSSLSLSTVFMAQELSCETSLSMRSLTPNESFGDISSIRHRAGIRVEATAFVPFSYF